MKVGRSVRSCWPCWRRCWPARGPTAHPAQHGPLDGHLGGDGAWSNLELLSWRLRRTRRNYRPRRNSWAKPTSRFPTRSGAALAPEGNARQAEYTADNKFFIGTNEDFALYGVTSFSIATGPHAGQYPSVPVPGSAPITLLADDLLNGPVVYRGYGCPASAPVPQPGDTGLPRPGGRRRGEDRRPSARTRGRPLCARRGCSQGRRPTRPPWPAGTPSCSCSATRAPNRRRSATCAGRRGITLADGLEGFDEAG